MSILDTTPSRWANPMLAVLRIVSGLLFMSTGSMKLFNYPPGMPDHPSFLHPLSLIGVAGILEFFGGLAIALGFCTRPVAFIVSGEMAVAYFMKHYPTSFFPTVNNGVPAVLYCFIFLYLVFSGPGAWSIDGILSRRRPGRL